MTKDWIDYLQANECYSIDEPAPQSGEYRDEYDGCPEYAAYCEEWT